MVEPCLFLGGPKDGEVLDVDVEKHHFLQVPEWDEKAMVYDPSPDFFRKVVPMVTTRTYRAVLYRCRSFDFIVYILDGQPADLAERRGETVIFSELPDWITQRRMAVAKGLYLAWLAFEYSIDSVARYHGLK